MRNLLLMAASLLAVGCTTETGTHVADDAEVTFTPAAAYATRAAVPGGDPLFPEVAQFEPAHPPGSCVGDEEIRADQFIKLHTEMMVTGLTCREPFRDPTLFSHYQTFTTEHQEMIRESQRTLGRFLGRYRSGNSNRLFDTYRTKVANGESQALMDVSATRYCAAYRDKFYSVARFDEVELEAYLDQAADRYRHRYEVCD